MRIKLIRQDWTSAIPGNATADPFCNAIKRQTGATRCAVNMYDQELDGYRGEFVGCIFVIKGRGIYETGIYPMGAARDLINAYDQADKPAEIEGLISKYENQEWELIETHGLLHTH